MHARVVLGVGKGVLFREVSSVQECPHREREMFHWALVLVMWHLGWVKVSSHPHTLTLSRGNKIKCGF